MRRSPIDAEPRTNGAPADRFEEQWGVLRSEILRIFSGTQRAVAIERHRATLLLVNGIFRAAFAISLFAFGLAASVAAALLVVRGMSGGLRAWSGTDWVGDLASGALLILSLLGGGLAVRAQFRNRLVRRARKVAAGAE